MSSRADAQQPPDIDISERPVPEAVDLASVPARLRRILAARGVRSDGELDLSFAGLAPPRGLGDLELAATRVADAVTGGEKLLVVGDFDADGATSVALMVRVLRAMGAEQVDYLVPNRFDYGYGLSPEIAALAGTREPDVLITVDNGISSVAGVAVARSAGIDVIITDHHLPGAELPAALALVNPNLPGAAFPSKALAGVGVAYYLLSAVRAELRTRGWFESREAPNLARYLDLVALGTVADVVPLDHNNRILVHQGLARMRRGQCCPGIVALAEVAKRDLGRLHAADLGFALGPRLNAAGRLDDMTIGIRALLTDDLAEARTLAAALNELNLVRRQLEKDMVAEAEMLLRQRPVDPGEHFGVCVYEPTWHQGVVGIVAGRLRETINRPVIAFAEAGDSAPGELKGSARSVPGLHIRDTLDAIAARHPGLLLKFGGHAMAAGLSVKRIHYDQFSRAFDEAVRTRLPASALARRIETDGALPPAELTLEFARLLRNFSPWGAGFPEPQFHGDFDVVSERIVGEQHLRLVLRQEDRLLDAIAFRQAPLGAARVRMVYRLDENDYRAQSTLQLMVEHIEALA